MEYYDAGIKVGKVNKVTSEFLKKHFEETPQKELDKEWKEIEPLNDIGPNVLEYRVQPQPRQEWSEEDEQILLGIIDELKANKSESPEYDYDTYDRFIDWLESLRHKNGWKPSDEQMNALDSTLQYSQVSHDSYEQLNSLYNDLKKLTNNYGW